MRPHSLTAVAINGQRVFLSLSPIFFKIFRLFKNLLKNLASFICRLTLSEAMPHLSGASSEKCQLLLGHYEGCQKLHLLVQADNRILQEPVLNQPLVLLLYHHKFT